MGIEGAEIALKSCPDPKAKRGVTVLDDYMHDFNNQGNMASSDLQLVYPSRQYMAQCVQGFIDLLLAHFNNL